ncbi:Zn-dependent peptidase ImmA, M78 family [Nitrosomonas sp. Nm51]|uniref:helix-turn-helix domain-containing protein n=1 Tax=Nitrosomonas sp. Nm51 TaxID=133720 RepID=UPI0008C79560|nr:ImmA/IrrE family metallo-endopeptidase [Nitrosomonas sp. Nm51]SER83563.1 Zn-dependent peptidase ImmA, M78 family [Nitrosomonas sp. Nm51]
MFNPSRLILARKRRRYTGKGLAIKIGVSPVTISRIEKSCNEPDKGTIEAIAHELKFPVGFFLGEDVDEPRKESVSFRSLSSMSAKERDAAISAGAIAYLFSDWVTERFNLPEVDLLDLSHERDPSHAARTLRQYWGLGEKPISNIIKLLESKGVKIFSLSENTKNVDAFSCWRNDVPYIFLNTYKTPERSRFDTGHELAHLVLHKHGGPKGREAETEANRFAASFLMPESDVISRLPRISTLDQIIQAKTRWGVSAAALAYTLHKLGIISDWQHRTICIELPKRYGTTEPNGIERERSVVWEKVLRELWNERTTKADVAESLHVPTEEIENLIFGLTGIDQNIDGRLMEIANRKPVLKIVR